MSRRKQSNPAKLESGRLSAPPEASEKPLGYYSPVPGPSGLQTPSESVMSKQSKVSSSLDESESGDSRSSPPVSAGSINDNDNNGDSPYSCSICNETFTKGQLLIEHEQIHSDHLQFTCSYCPRLFKHKRSRDRHTKLHTGDKKYKCLQCESAFSRSDHLKIHMKTHDSRKPYKCGSCNRRYNTAAALSSHQQIHLKLDSKMQNNDGSTPSPNIFRCHLCTDTFNKSEILQNHLLNNHSDSDSPSSQTDFQTQSECEEIKIVCMYCSKDFPNIDLMYQHVSVQHKEFQNGVSSISPKSDKNSSDKSNTNQWSQQNPFQEFNLSALSINYSSLQMQPTDLSRRHKYDEDESENHNKKKKKKTDSNLSSSNSYGSIDKPCICSCCYAQLPNFKSFLRHMETHMISANNTLLGFCPICGDPNINSTNFTNHIFGHAIVQVAGLYCYSCKKTFEHADKLQKHLIDVHVVNVYRCSICNEIFDTKLSMQLHLTNKHSEECKYFKCNLCANQEFHDRLSAELHISMKHYHQFAPCITNKSLLQSQYSMDLNSRIGDYGQFQCAFCEKNFKDKYSQYLHILNEHNDVVKDEEKYMFDSSKLHQSSSLSIPSPDQTTPSKNLDTKKSEFLYTCDICNISDIPSEMDLITHKKLHNSTKSKTTLVSLQCAYCNEYCKSRSDLENHMKTHQVSCGKGKHKCNICDEIFSSSMTLADHKLNHCKIVDGNTCVQCKSVLSNEQSFYNHQLQHSNKVVKQNSQITLPANCIVCCQTLQTDIEIKLHAKFHLKHLFQNEVFCGVCNKTFDSQSGQTVISNTTKSDNLTVSICKDCSNINNNGIKNKQYVSIQTTPFKCKVENNTQSLEDQTNFECQLCKQKFVSSFKLQTHLIEHNFFGMNQYSCYVCSSVFTAAVGLQNHIVEHGLDSKPYECSQCQVKFFFRTELDNHRFSHILQSPSSSSRKSYTPLLPYSSSNGSCNGNNGENSLYKTCKYCPNTFIDGSFYIEHLNQCPFKLSPKTDIDMNVKIEVNVKEEVVDTVNSDDR